MTSSREIALQTQLMCLGVASIIRTTGSRDLTQGREMWQVMTAMELARWRSEHIRSIQRARRDPARVLEASRAFMTRRHEYISAQYTRAARALEDACEACTAPTNVSIERMSTQAREMYEERLCVHEASDHPNPAGRAYGEVLAQFGCP
jgi:hypothetical protein